MPTRIFNPSRTIWTANLSPTGFSARIEAIPGDVILISVSTNFLFSTNPGEYQERTISEADMTLSDPVNNIYLFSVTISDLIPSKTYYIAVKRPEKSVSTLLARVFTFPIVNQPKNFTFCAGADSKLLGDAGKTYHAIMGEQSDPLFMLHLGNFFSGPLGSKEVSTYNSLYKTALKDSFTADFLSNKPMYYIFDGYDYGTINGTVNSPTAKAAVLAYKNFYPLSPEILFSGDPYIFQTFTVGRVRFIITDLRSQSTGLISDETERSTLGKDQRERLFRELEEFSKYRLIVWANSKTWHEPTDNTSDQWAGYSVERTQIANHIARIGVNNLVMLTGQSGMLAIDDGTNTDFSTSGGAGIPLMDVSPIAFWASGNRATYSGPSKGFTEYPNFQYAKLKVTDTEESTCFTMSGCSMGTCNFSQKMCINATNPSIIQHRGSGISGSNVVLPMFPYFVWATMFAFSLIAILLSGLILTRGFSRTSLIFSRGNKIEIAKSID